MVKLEDQFLELIEKELRIQLGACSFSQRLQSALEYVLFPGGKRLRPLFSLFLCKDLGGDRAKVLPAAAAIELVHCASLVHDDLPAFDNDSMRRGRATCHCKFDEATAILTGDVLSMLSIKILTGLDLKSQEKAKLIDALAEAFLLLCDGQQLDLNSEDRKTDLERIHREKTGALFSCAAIFPALIIGLENEALNQVGALGADIGVYFQLVDDYVDAFGSDQARGRIGSSDKRNCRETLWALGNQEQAVEILRGWRLRVNETLRLVEGCKPGLACEGVRHILDRISRRVG